MKGCENMLRHLSRQKEEAKISLRNHSVKVNRKGVQRSRSENPNRTYYINQQKELPSRNRKREKK